MTDEYDVSKKGLSIASLVMGILSIVFFWVPLLPFLLCLLAVIFAGVSLKKKEGIKGLSIAGLVLGVIVLAIYGLTFLLVGGLAGLGLMIGLM